MSSRAWNIILVVLLFLLILIVRIGWDWNDTFQPNPKQGLISSAMEEVKDANKILP